VGSGAAVRVKCGVYGLMRPTLKAVTVPVQSVVPTADQLHEMKDRLCINVNGVSRIS
jgi:hypothetical protein